MQQLESTPGDEHIILHMIFCVVGIKVAHRDLTRLCVPFLRRLVHVWGKGIQFAASTWLDRGVTLVLPV